MRFKADEIDHWCTEWARVRRAIHGITLASMLEPKDTLGKLSCTLGRIKEDAEGASAIFLAGAQNWPEVYTGMGLLMHRAWLNMPLKHHRLVMDAHYVWREIPVRHKAPVIGISIRDYWTRLEMLKSYLQGYVQMNRDARESAPCSRSPLSVRLFR